MEQLVEKGCLLKEEEKYEVCVLCGCKTNIKFDLLIEERVGYIEGVGQLCGKCFREMNFKQ